MIRLPFGTGEYALDPRKIIAVGLNYADHVVESLSYDHEKLDLPSEPVLFAKTPNVLIGPGEAIVIPAYLFDLGFDEVRVDPEAELAVIISRTCSRVSEADAMDYVLGYTCFNDVSQRNIQKGDASGWFRGKSLDSFRTNWAANRSLPKKSPIPKTLTSPAGSTASCASPRIPRI
jgi:2-keto-4-pentenoate hydratase/2-oxohepta-3-ene-1,7-dioic acid hydratase in catechol pathway